jgi:spore maturation protein CgeB
MQPQVIAGTEQTPSDEMGARLAAPSNALSILFLGSSEYGDSSTGVHRVEALQRLGHTVTVLDYNTPFSSRLHRLIPVRILHRMLQSPMDLGRVNFRGKKVLAKAKFDVVWLDKSLVIKPNFLRQARRLNPGIKIIGYSPDDSMNPSNQSRRFLDLLPLYDLFCTTKSYNCAELQALGCRSTFFVDNAYHRGFHEPIPVSAADRASFGGDVAFIGSWEPERAESIRALANRGVRVRIWGDGWQNMRNPPPNLQIEYRALFGQSYVKAINGSKINLCFLRKQNRDLQTTRSIEIPACGGFMLAEQTDEHLRLFEKGVEADFFSSDSELLEKVEYYLNHDSERHKVAANGRNRCLRSDYSNESRLASILSHVFTIT